MASSASALNKLLTAAIKSVAPDKRFLMVLAEQLSPEDPLPEIEVVQILYKLVQNIQEDIERLPLDEDAKEKARRQIAPFLGLISFSHIHQTTKVAKSNFLTHANLVELNDINFLLEDHFEYPKVDKEKLKDLASKFSEIRNEVLNADLPERLKLALLYRLRQISAILENYYAFGPEELERDLESLIGAIVINKNLAEQTETNKLFGKIWAASSDGVTFLKSVDSGYTLGESLAAAGTKLLSLFQ